MVSARGFMVALGAGALVVAGAQAGAAGQAGAGQDSQPRNGAFSRYDPQLGTGSGRGAGKTVGAASAKAAAPTAEAAAPSAPAARPEIPSPEAAPAPPASPAAEAAVAATPAAGRTPLALSHEAFEKAPSIGVIGGGDGAGPSPAATPEPSTLLLMGAGLAGLYRLRRRR